MNIILMKCKCGKTVEVNVNSDGWYVLEDVDYYGCGYWRCGFRR